MTESLRGSGFYQEIIPFDPFVCENQECGYQNDGGEVDTNDWGSYEIVCKKCWWTFYKGNIHDEEEHY